MAPNLKLYGVPWIPAGGVCPGVSTGGPGVLIVTVKACEPLAGGCALSVTVTVNVKEPAAVGVPVSDPSAPSMRPPGKAPEVIAHVNGGEPPVAVNEKPS